ncbi:MAG: pyridoxamine 5'-phosphate oxidase family protein [Oscillospiraceae bacterium]|nr:pyridoxamine 5'-phosphate oxidase family protein [Oscillospiraceae bacterium]
MTNEELMSLVNRSLFAALGYTDKQGRPSVRRVFCVWHKGLARHLISTNTCSEHVQSLMQNGNACLYFSDDAKFEGLCLYGNVTVHFEEAYRALLWNPGDEKYYPAGISDPDYCVLEFAAESGRFYRYDGKGELTAEMLAESEAGRKFENGYAAQAAG